MDIKAVEIMVVQSAYCAYPARALCWMWRSQVC